MVVGVVSAVALFVVNEILGVTDIHFLLVAPIVFALCCLAMVVTSLATPGPSAEAVGQYLWTPATYKAESAELEGTPLWANYRFLALLTVLISVGHLIWLW